MNTRTTTTTPPTDAADRWWRVGVMWLVIGGPLAVVVAGFATLAIALAHPDPVQTGATPASPAERPAVEARNHAAQPAERR